MTEQTTPHDKQCEQVTWTVPQHTCRCRQRTLERELTAARQQLADLSPNAQWLSLAHIACANEGIPPGHIKQRLGALIVKLAAVASVPREQFQNETLRVSELSQLLLRFMERYKHEGHTHGPWSRNCELCALVKAAEELMAKPISAPSAAPQPEPVHANVFEAASNNWQRVAMVGNCRLASGQPFVKEFAQQEQVVEKQPPMPIGAPVSAGLAADPCLRTYLTADAFRQGRADGLRQAKEVLHANGCSCLAEQAIEALIGERK